MFALKHLARVTAALTIALLISIGPNGVGTAHAEITVVEAFPNLFFFTIPIDLRDPMDGSDRVFVAEKAGRIYSFANNPTVSGRLPFLDIRHKVFDSFASGFQSFAFHPDYVNNGHIYVGYSAENPLRLVIERYTVSATDSNAIDTTTVQTLLEVQKDNIYHNGMTLLFGPNDGYLYISLGDDGSPGKPMDLTNLNGSILRIDVDNPSGGNNYGIPADNPFVGNVNGWHEEIYAYGLRNPWRVGPDVVTGEIYIGDVGNDVWEEIDLLEKEANYGYPYMEGPDCLYLSPCDTTGLNLTPPIHAYDHSLGVTVIGGPVYRGSKHPGIVGWLLWLDYFSGRIWGADLSLPEFIPVRLYSNGQFNGVMSFGFDADNEIYLCNENGRIYKLEGDYPWSPVGVTPQAPQGTIAGNYPNPFNPTTTIQYSISVSAAVRLDIVNVAGQLVRSFREPLATAGSHDVTWDGNDQSGVAMPSGVYFSRLYVDGIPTSSLKMVLLK